MRNRGESDSHDVAAKYTTHPIDSRDEPSRMNQRMRMRMISGGLLGLSGRQSPNREGKAQGTARWDKRRKQEARKEGKDATIIDRHVGRRQQTAGRQRVPLTVAR